MPEKELSAVMEKPSASLPNAGEATGIGPLTWSAGSPWQMMRRMQEEVDRVFSQFIVGPSDLRLTAPILPEWSPNVDISETDTEFCIEAELPGVKQKDITLEMFRHQLTLHATVAMEKETKKTGRQYYRRERHSGHMMRTLTLPANVDEEKIHCEFENGVLTCHVPKVDTYAPIGRRIPIGKSGTSPEKTAN